MKIQEYKKFSELIRDTDVYKVFDYKGLLNLTLSFTELGSLKNTKGHSHSDADEIYFFVLGHGEIIVNGDRNDCEAGDVFIIPRGAFHKVANLGNEKLCFWSVFEKYGDRK